MKMNMQEYQIEKMAFDTAAEDAAKAKKRMARICATPEEQALYRYAPLQARNNRHPGQPFDDDSFPPYSE